MMQTISLGLVTAVLTVQQSLGTPVQAVPDVADLGLEYDLNLSNPDVTLSTSTQSWFVEQALCDQFPLEQSPRVTFPLAKPKARFASATASRGVSSAQIMGKKAPLEPSAYDPLFEKYGAQFGVDPGKLKAIANCESHINPASNGTYKGMYQYLPSTWKSTREAMGADPSPELVFDAEQAIMTTAWKIAAGGIGAWPVCGRR